MWPGRRVKSLRVLALNMSSITIAYGLCYNSPQRGPSDLNARQGTHFYIVDQLDLRGQGFRFGARQRGRP